jgi:hypothetical protein
MTRYKSNIIKSDKGYCKVKVKTKNFDALPLHACKDNHRLTFAHFELD